MCLHRSNQPCTGLTHAHTAFYAVTSHEKMEPADYECLDFCAAMNATIPSGENRQTASPGLSRYEGVPGAPVCLP